MNDSKRILPGLPSGWVWTELGGIINPSKEKVNPLEFQGIPFIGLEHIEKDTGKILSHGLSNEVRSTKSRFNSGDLLYGKLRPYLNKVSVADFDGVCSTDILVFSSSPNISNKYLFFRFLCGDFVKYASQNVSGVQHPRVNFKTLSQFNIPLPPLPEQHRIVARIEQLFTNLDAGMESLKAARAQLKRYRQSVLKSACEGRLVPTEAELARAEGREYQPAEVLLERILEERRRKWEENKKGKRYKEAALPDMTEMSELPEGWCWVNLEQYSFEVKDGTHDSPKYQLSGIPFVTQKNIKHSGLNFSKMNYISIEDHNNFYRRSNPTRGDIIISMIGANRGMSCIVNVDTVFSIKNVGLVKPYKFYNSIKFLDIFMKSPVGQRIILEKSRGGAQSFIGLTELRGWLISLPPLAEQHRIVAEVERRLSVADEMEKTIEQSLKQAERLRQSILKRAFDGKLVPQDPEDEPAGVLLERILREKEIHEQNNKSKRRKAHGNKA
jgi:type I restriction enzyme S subunit